MTAFALGVVTALVAVALVCWSCWPEFELMRELKQNGPNED